MTGAVAPPILASEAQPELQGNLMLLSAARPMSHGRDSQRRSRLVTKRALAVGLMVSRRNLGLMLAATDGVLPGAAWLYFALSQLPIYLSPPPPMPIVARLDARNAASSGRCTAPVRQA